MLVVKQVQGKNVVTFHKDWHPAMIGKGYVPKPKRVNHVDTPDMLKVQAALLQLKGAK